MPSTVQSSIDIRLRKKLIKTKEGCLVWQGAKFRNGAGMISNKHHGQSPLQTHRVAFELWVRKLEDFELVMQNCKNKACCEPEHLFVSNQKAAKKKRSARKREQDQIRRRQTKRQKYIDKRVTDETTQLQKNRIEFEATTLID